MQTQIGSVDAEDGSRKKQAKLPGTDTQGVRALLSFADRIPDVNEYAELSLSAKRGDPAAECRLGWYYCCHLNDVDETCKWFHRAAEHGDGEAQFTLFLMYGTGTGVEYDPAEGVKWLFRAARQGYAKAQYEVGCSTERTASTRARAAEWYRRAAEQGYAKAQHNLGRMYHVGEGVKQDYVEAVKWYRKAAEQGHAQAQCKLAITYHRGEGVQKDFVEAAKWCRRAAEQGDDIAQHLLAILYYRGQGVIEDYVEAYKWAILAFMNARDTMSLKEEIRKLLSPIQIEEAQCRAKEFVPRKESEPDRSTH